ncbi:hypothetical protein [Actinomadura sp. B10D3]|uniref:hypothetical protein n=1 Tax=Actinomadura sp. B10D3 TaxID=3153557 RepID=UPI00325E1950
MAGLVTILNPGETLPAAGHFAGPWRDFARTRIAPHARETFAGDGSESAIFVMSGSATARVGDTDTPLAEGGAVTVGLGSRVDLTAGPDGVELFITTLTVQVD